MRTILSVHRHGARVHRSDHPDGASAVTHAKGLGLAPDTVVLLMSTFPNGDRHQQCYKVTDSGGIRYSHERFTRAER